MHFSRNTWLLLLAWLVAVPAFAQRLPAGPQVLTIFSDIDDTEQPYALYLPPNYDESKAYPFVMMLHGAGSNHRLALRRVFGKSNEEGATDVETSRVFPDWKAVDYIVAAPFARGTTGYQGIAEQDVMDILADVKKRFRIDENRMYLTGLSMGGGGSLWIGLTRPDLWAAIAPVCPAPPQGTEVFAPNVLNVPMHFFQGGADPVVKPEGTRQWVENLKQLGTQVTYKEFPGVQHDSWVQAYQDEFIFDWFRQFTRNPYPDRVRFATDRYAYNGAYWVTLDQLTTGTPSEIDVQFTAPNTLEVTTHNLNAFTLQLADHPKFNAGAPLALSIDGKKLKKVPAAGTLHLSKQDKGKWAVAPYTAPAMAKQPGAEGPISAAFAERHVYVYGTADDPTPEELQKRMAMAQKAADWSTYRGEFLGRVMVFPRVLADKDVRPSDFAEANLILFGTQETNRIIAQYSDQLPLQLDPGASDLGLLYVYPVQGHYVVVNSGLPWWANQEASGMPFVPSVQRLLGGFKDFVLFKGSADQVVTDGYFDQHWQLPAEAAAAMQATHSVAVTP